MLNDPHVFPEPECFKPERYLANSQEDGRGDAWTPRALAREEDPMQIAFGFGRRCALVFAFLSGSKYRLTKLRAGFVRACISPTMRFFAMLPRF